MACGLLVGLRMKLIAATGAVLFTLCGPALADSAKPSPPDTCDGSTDAHPKSAKVHFVQHDTDARTFDLVVGVGSCQSMSEKVPDRQLDVRACVSDGKLDVTWSSISTRGEYRGTASLPFEHHTTTVIGIANSPHL